GGARLAVRVGMVETDQFSPGVARPALLAGEDVRRDLEASPPLVHLLPRVLHRHYFPHDRLIAQSLADQQAADLIRVPALAVSAHLRLQCTCPHESHATSAITN